MLKVLLAKRLIGFDVVCADRTRRPDQLFYIFDIANHSRQSFYKHPNLFVKLKGSIFKVIRLSDTLWSGNCFCHLRFRN